MKYRPILLSLILLITGIGVMIPRQAQAAVDFSYFYDNLSPYGEWVDVADYGYCWRPTAVNDDWRPYTDGYWAFTDAGWTWVSYEDFGSITYHYGRWVRLEDYGWVWHPDYEWGPAWVSWRKNDSYVGWAPLPPECAFRPGIGISITVDRDFDIGPSYYSFCEFRNFGAPVLRDVIVRRDQNVTIINNTTNITNITYNNNRTVVYNGGPDFRTMSRASQRPIQTLRLDRRTDVPLHGGGIQPSQRVGNQLVVNAPIVERSAKPFVPLKVARVISKPQVDKGWAGTDPAVKQQIRQRIAQETKGVAKDAPARQVDERNLQQVLPPASASKAGPGQGGRRPAMTETTAPATTGQAPEGQQPMTPPARGKGKQRLQPFTPPTQPVQPSAPAEAAQTVQPAAPAHHGKGKQKLQPFTPEMQPESVPAKGPSAEGQQRQQEQRAAQAQQHKAEQASQAQQQHQAAQAAQAQQQHQAKQAAQAQQERQTERAAQVQQQRQVERPAKAEQPRPQRRPEQAIQNESKRQRQAAPQAGAQQSKDEHKKKKNGEDDNR